MVNRHGYSGKIVRTRHTPVRVATGSAQNATRGCEERDKAVRTGREIATGCSSHSERNGFAVATRPQNVAYRAVAFTGSAPESDKERTCSWIAVEDCLIFTQGRNRRNGEEERLGVGDLLLPSHQELLHTTPKRCKLVPKGLVESPSLTQEIFWFLAWKCPVWGSFTFGLPQLLEYI
ncbi:hypothetical protein Taro_028454 [Colocasia esculenta]|uniref:Uncharacterized protein n=1 Tax=Colocasia esculenta TaxID=4460 RepID=A0A843VRX1_COLES|nr:hypothetical protein [Colocasia esculenta]